MSSYQSPCLNSLIVNDKKAVDQALEKLAGGGMRHRISDEGRAKKLESLASGGLTSRTTESLVSRQTEVNPFNDHAIAEAIVLSVVRPPLLVRDGTFVPPNAADTVQEVMDTIKTFKRKKIDPAIAIAGRIEFKNVPGVPFVGTGWVIEKPKANRAIVVTNRHVAEEFAYADGRGEYVSRQLPNYRDYEVALDFAEEHGSITPREVSLVKVLFIAGPSASDMALLEMEGEALKKVMPIEMATKPVKDGDPIGLVGYPAYDSRNDAEDMRRYFGDIFNVKRFAFGYVTGILPSISQFTHDATTLGGNSGSEVFNRDTGKIVGLHFAGEYKTANYAVNIDEVKTALKGLSSTTVVSSSYKSEATNDGTTKPAEFKGRDGYNEKFLGSALKPPKPGSTWKDDLSDVVDADSGGTSKELKYRHFSVWMSNNRKLPLLTAVNIDGLQAKRLGRVDKWYNDGRLGKEFQVDNIAYVKNPLDRGHMVRREDPVWGDLEIAQQANLDTFHYTNAAPQHEDLNQRDWVNLEDYVLGNAKTHDLKLSVFTGPVFADDDPLYRNAVRLPRSYWKIAAVVNSETHKLSVTGYLLSQGDLIKGLTGEFVYGAFRTYQVEVAEIGKLARLDVKHLIKHDPLTAKRKNEGVTGLTAAFRVVNGSGDLIL